jgi:uncharacterized small protein (TIGR04563 family)
MNPAGRKRSFYLPDWMTRELEAEATRLDRSVSWILQRAWKLARADLIRAARAKAAARAAQPGGTQEGNGAPA